MTGIKTEFEIATPEQLKKLVPIANRVSHAFAGCSILESMTVLTAVASRIYANSKHIFIKDKNDAKIMKDLFLRDFMSTLKHNLEIAIEKSDGTHVH